jgi:hypothetical protein
MSSDDMIFTVSDETQSLVKFHLPNDVEFKQLVDESIERFGRAEIAFEVVRSQFRR